VARSTECSLILIISTPVATYWDSFGPTQNEEVSKKRRKNYTEQQGYKEIYFSGFTFLHTHQNDKQKNHNSYDGIKNGS